MADEQPIHIDAERARAGATPHMTRVILAVSLVLVILAYALIVYVF